MERYRRDPLSWDVPVEAAYRFGGSPPHVWPLLDNGALRSACGAGSWVGGKKTGCISSRMQPALFMLILILLP